MANITSKTIKDREGLSNYTPQCLNFDNRRPFNLGLHEQKEMKDDNSPFKAKEGKYWYKINGKNVTKEEYNAYKNEPGNMEGGGKTTNDPDASGNKAKIQAAREKLPRPSTVLTEAQTKVKNQGTKIKKKPPFKNKTPLKSWLDKMQTGLSVAGMVPLVGNLADAANTAVSAGRAGYAKYKGDDKAAKKHSAAAAINAAAMIPGAGQAVTAGKLAAKGGKALAKGVVKKGKEMTKEKVAKKLVKKGTVSEGKQASKKAIDKKSSKPGVAIKKSNKLLAGKGPLKPKAKSGGKPKVGFKTGLEGITA